MKTLTASFFWALLAASAFGQTKLEGVWQSVEVKTESGANAGTVSKAPGILIFTDKNHYSMIVPLSDTRHEVADPAKASAAELAESWKSIVASAGIYEISGDTLTLRPTVAKNPGVVGASLHLPIKVTGDTLTIAVNPPKSPGWQMTLSAWTRL